MSAARAWHPEVITAPMMALLGSLAERQVIKEFYLAGGTGLALALGHRRSVDLDFFSPDQFSEEGLLGRIESWPEFQLTARDEQTVHAVMNGVKVSFLGYRYPLLFSTHRLAGAAVADPRDIGCMKLNAIASRGSKRDFVDLYALAQTEPLSRILDWSARKYAQTNYNPLHVVKSLTFFDDAEKEPMPNMLASYSWDQVKHFLREQAPGLL